MAQPAMAGTQHFKKWQVGGWMRATLMVFAGLPLTSAFLLPGSAAPSQSAQAPPSRDSSQQNQSGSAAAAVPKLPRGKKLMLKDGSFQLIREYKVESDRVRYYSLDSGQWEEMPTALVDWDATRKMETDEAKRDAELVAKVHAREKEQQAPPLDIDASLETAPGVFLPPGEGLFLFVGKAVLQLTPAETNERLDKGHVLKEVLIPFPGVATRFTISIKGAHAKLRVNQQQPEFYMRVAEGQEPEMQLVPAKIHEDKRDIENVDKRYGREGVKWNNLPIQRWEVARGVYRFTVSQPLEAGEYALVEIVHSEMGMSLYAWDFGVDSNPNTKTK
jgi:hypothetical protein